MDSFPNMAVGTTSHCSLLNVFKLPFSFLTTLSFLSLMSPTATTTAEFGSWNQLREQQRQYREPGIIFGWNIVARDIEIKLIREPETPGLEHFWAIPETNNEEPLNGGVDFGSLSELPLRCHFCTFE
ncbi:Uncharacterized protein Adt_36345 [Abeliophyllum distichum]|uniref:Uncharacterized protein n=1 Tax=Abeliophyllum distichum TaxID=126358 RepID=A0ABD1QH93_9LAMI